MKVLKVYVCPAQGQKGKLLLKWGAGVTDSSTLPHSPPGPTLLSLQNLPRASTQTHAQLSIAPTWLHLTSLTTLWSNVFQTSTESFKSQVSLLLMCHSQWTSCSYLHIYSELWSRAGSISSPTSISCHVYCMTLSKSLSGVISSLYNSTLYNCSRCTEVIVRTVKPCVKFPIIALFSKCYFLLLYVTGAIGSSKRGWDMIRVLSKVHSSSYRPTNYFPNEIWLPRKAHS